MKITFNSLPEVDLGNKTLKVDPESIKFDTPQEAQLAANTNWAQLLEEIGKEKAMRHFGLRPLKTCETCNGTGKEICNNPDHGFIDALSFHDIGRIGCPCCGHDPNHAIPKTVCPECKGTGKV